MTAAGYEDFGDWCLKPGVAITHKCPDGHKGFIKLPLRENGMTCGCGEEVPSGILLAIKLFPSG